jgi:hypothetical protein
MINDFGLFNGNLKTSISQNVIFESNNSKISSNLSKSTELSNRLNQITFMNLKVKPDAFLNLN